MSDKKHRYTTPPDTTTPAVYCAHEYTLANAKFAASVEPSNARLQERLVEVQDKRQRGEPTVPTQMGLEKATNPFLRYASPEIRKVRLLHAAMRDAYFSGARLPVSQRRNMSSGGVLPLLPMPLAAFMQHLVILG